MEWITIPIKQEGINKKSENGIAFCDAVFTLSVHFWGKYDRRRNIASIASQSNSELWRVGERRKLRWSPFWRTSSCARCPKRRGEEGSCSR